MNTITMIDLLEAGVHFGHPTRKWNPKMKQYIYTARDGVHVIDLAMTQQKLKEAAKAIEGVVRSGKEIILVGTKRQAAVIVEKVAQDNDIPYLTQRWLGGMLTNFENVSMTWGRFNELEEKFKNKKEMDALSTRDQYALRKEHEKLKKLVGGLHTLKELPGMIFVVDVKRDKTAVEEAYKMKVPVVALVDTNVDPSFVAYPIPGNDDGIKSIKIITEAIAEAVKAGRKAKK